MEDIRNIIDRGRMRPVQVLVICLCFSVNLLDGMDVLAISLAAPLLSEQWQIPPDKLGIVFGASLFGMLLGAVLIAPLADRIGRRKQIMGCLLVAGAGMLATALAESIPALMMLRFVTGLGLGGILPSMISMPSEFSPLRSRNLAVTIVSASYPLGIVILGLIAARIMTDTGWQSVFVLPGLLSLLVLPVVYRFMPESLQYLLDKRPAGALREINRILHRMGYDELDRLPPLPPEGAGTSTGISTLFSPEYIKSTLLLWIAFLLCFTTMFVVTSWIPQLMVNTGLSIEKAIYAGVSQNVGAFFGMISLGFLADRIGLRRVIVLWLILATVLMATFGYFETPAMVLLAIGCIGFTVQGGFIGLYAAAARIYPTLIRNTGIGMAIGIARVGAVAGPYIAGLLVLYGFSMAQIFMVFAVPLLLTSLSVYLIPARQLASTEL